MVFFEEWIYMKSPAMWQYFQYICKKVPFQKVPCIESGGSEGVYTWQHTIQMSLSGVPIWDRLLWAGGDLKSAAVGWWLGRYWLRRAGGQARQAGGHGDAQMNPLSRKMKSHAVGFTLMAMSRRSGMVDAIGGEVVYNNNYYYVWWWWWCMVWWGASAVSGSNPVFCPLFKINRSTCRNTGSTLGDTVQVWRTWMVQFGDPLSGCYQIANDKSPASLRGRAKNI